MVMCLGGGKKYTKKRAITEVPGWGKPGEGLGDRSGAMQDRVYELPRIPFSRTSENPIHAKFVEFYFYEVG
jgi:hypothetical protein